MGYGENYNFEPIVFNVNIYNDRVSRKSKYKKFEKKMALKSNISNGIKI